MKFRLVRCGVLLAALALPLGGCLETVGRPSYYHHASSYQTEPCHPANQPEGGQLGYGCPAKSPD
jgi:hypothetical protein